MKKISLIGVALFSIFLLTSCSNNSKGEWNTTLGTFIKKSSSEILNNTNESQSKDTNEAIPNSTTESSSTSESSSSMSIVNTSKPSGYSFDMIGTANDEDVHIITADEAGTYDIECYNVPVPDNFAEFRDYQDLQSFVTIFPDDKKYDSGMDADKALFDQQLCTSGNIDDLQKNGIKNAHYSAWFDLKKGNQIMVLNGSVKFTKQ